MLLGGLFEELLRQGVTLVITSNVPPSGLYRDGLQRARFLPAITLLERELEVLEVDGGTDYRLRQLRQAPIYLMAADPATQRWWAIMEPMQVPLPNRGPGEWWARMEEVFHHD